MNWSYDEMFIPRENNADGNWEEFTLILVSTWLRTSASEKRFKNISVPQQDSVVVVHIKFSIRNYFKILVFIGEML